MSALLCSVCMARRLPMVAVLAVFLQVVMAVGSMFDDADGFV